MWLLKQNTPTCISRGVLARINFRLSFASETISFTVKGAFSFQTHLFLKNDSKQSFLSSHKTNHWKRRSVTFNLKPNGGRKVLSTLGFTWAKILNSGFSTSLFIFLSGLLWYKATVVNHPLISFSCISLLSVSLKVCLLLLSLKQWKTKARKERNCTYEICLERSGTSLVFMSFAM